MKKILKLTLLILIATNSFSQNKNYLDRAIEKSEYIAKSSLVGIEKGFKKSKDFIVEADTSSTSKAIYKDIKSFLSATGQALKVKSEQVFEVYTKYFFIEGLVYIIFIVIAYYIGLKVILYSIREIKKGEVSPIYLFGVLIPGILALSTIHIVILSIQKIIVPEYFVLQELINFIKNIK